VAKGRSFVQKAGGRGAWERRAGVQAASRVRADRWQLAVCLTGGLISGRAARPAGLLSVRVEGDQASISRLKSG
jgi:hypothetical protein